MSEPEVPGPISNGDLLVSRHKRKQEALLKLRQQIELSQSSESQPSNVPADIHNQEGVRLSMDHLSNYPAKNDSPFSRPSLTFLSKEQRMAAAQVKLQNELKEKEAKQQELIIQQILKRNETKHHVASIIRQAYLEEATSDDKSYSEDFLEELDDTDPPLDSPEGSEERERWKLRELLRMKRQEEERQAFESQRLELEKIRALKGEALEAYLQEKEQIVQQQKEEEKPAYQFLQKYYHKGAFFSDATDPILSRDYAAPTAADRMDKTALPAFMQVRNYGKMSRSKWTHLSAEDTTGFDGPWYEKPAKKEDPTATSSSSSNPNKKYKL